MLDHGAKWIRNSQGVTCCFTVITRLNFDLQRPNMAIHSVTLLVSQVEITSIIALFNDKSFPWQRTFNSVMWDQSCCTSWVWASIQQTAHIFSSSKTDFENLSCQFYFEQQTLSYSTEWKDGWSHLELMVRFQSHLFIVSFVNSLHYFPSPHNYLPFLIFTLSSTT